MTTTIEQPDLLTEAEAAKLIRRAPGTLRNWRVQGRGPRFIKNGAAIQYDRSDLLGYLNDRRCSNTSEAAAF